MRHWLMKTEPTVFSIEDLERVGTEHWDGIRNYTARNFMRDDMQVGDGVLIHHSSTDVPGVAGTARVSKAAVPDPSCWDPKSEYFDPKSSKATPRWVMVYVTFESRFPRPLSLAELRTLPALKNMMLLKKGQRLSIMPVTPAEFEAVVRHAKKVGGAS